MLNNQLENQDKRKKVYYQVTLHQIITELFNLSSDIEALKDQWIVGDCIEPVSLPIANIAMVRENLVKGKGWIQIEDLAHISMKGLHIVSYIMDNSNQLDGNNIRRLISSSRLTPLTEEPHNNQDLLFISDFFKCFFSSKEAIDNYEKEKFCNFLNIHETNNYKIKSLEDIVFYRKNDIFEWIRLAFWLNRKDFFICIFDILKHTFEILSRENINFLLAISERHIIFYLLSELNAITSDLVLIELNEFHAYNEMTKQNNTTVLFLINVMEAAKAMNEIKDDYLPEFWKNIKKRRDKE